MAALYRLRVHSSTGKPVVFCLRPHKYTPLTLQKCDKTGLAISLFGRKVEAATLRPDAGQDTPKILMLDKRTLLDIVLNALCGVLWVQLDSHPIVPYTGFSEEGLAGVQRKLVILDHQTMQDF
jgi:hypothetical protein